MQLRAVHRFPAALLLTLLLAACSSRSGNVRHVATGYVSHVLCSYVFVSGLDPERVYAEEVEANPSFRFVAWMLSKDVDRTKREVRVRMLGGAESRSVYRDGLGCLNVQGDEAIDAPSRAEFEADGPVAPLLPDVAGPEIVEPATDALRRTLDAAFAEPEGGPLKRTHAVVIVKDGRVVAERYGPGWGIETPVHGWSMTKSIDNALLGILVRQGKIRMDQPAPVAAWSGPGDPRGAITLDNLLRMESGLDLGDSLSASLSSAWDISSRGNFNEVDQAAFAERAPLAAAPGTRWNYANGNPAILGRVVRDAVGGHAADVLRFARRELFGPLGMRRMTLELDATGSPIMGAFAYAPPREWARFGLLFLNDGVVGGRRILPEGWVSYSTTPTPDAWVGYGAGWWIDEGDTLGVRFRVSRGMPREAFFAQGIYGQNVIVVPRERLVIVRCGSTYDLRFAMEDASRLTANAIAATKAL
ncbi:MAG: serine hydrolase domain-containing protein [SAR324 cluster bacterium]